MVEIRNIQSRVVSVDDPTNHETTQGDFSGVVELSMGCTGTLLTTGRHLLTAAHCFFDNNGNQTENESNTSITFETSTGNVTINASQITIHPDYNSSTEANDIAIVELVSEAPAEATRHDIYRNSDEVGQIFTKVGYGAFGEGLDVTPGNNIKRDGLNRFDALGDIFNDATKRASFGI